MKIKMHILRVCDPWSVWQRYKRGVAELKPDNILLGKLPLSLVKWEIRQRAVQITAICLLL